LAITQISKIRARRGHLEDLPSPLSSAEFGWAIDARRLFIGNGEQEEGAPLIGNTEVLTEHSDITKLSGMYTFTGRLAGYTVQTGEGALSPMSRTLGDKLDDIANFRDFGGVGDGVTNEVRAFNRAIQQLHKTAVLNIESRVRRTLHIPAGVYILGDVTNSSSGTAEDYIKLLPFVKLRGDGKNATFIIQVNANAQCVVGNTDTALSTYPDFISNYTSIPHPGYNEIEGITLINVTANHVTMFANATDTLLTQVRMQHVNWNTTLPVPLATDSATVNAETATTGGLKTSCIALFGNDPALPSQLTFQNCEFIGTTTAITSEAGAVASVLFDNCFFSRLYRGCYLSQGATKIVASRFTDISHEAVYSPGVHSVVSAHNTFTNVGNALSATPVYAVLDLWGDNCYSIGDVFDRSSDAAVQAVNLRGKASFATLQNGRLMLGKQHYAGGRAITLTDGVVTATVAGVIGYGNRPTKLEYTVQRGTEQRTGTMHIAPVGTALTFSDDYVETDDIGVSLIPTLTGGAIELTYTTSSTTENATLTVASRTLT
jgi:hypothetical protein